MWPKVQRIRVFGPVGISLLTGDYLLAHLHKLRAIGAVDRDVEDAWSEMLRERAPHVDLEFA